MANLSHMLSPLRVVRGDWCQIDIGAPGGVRIARTERAHIYAVLDGHAVISCGHGPQVELWPGDTAILLRQKPHEIVDSRGSPVIRLRILEEPSIDADTVPVARVGGRGQGSRIIAGVCDLSVAPLHTMTNLLDDVIVVRQADQIVDIGACDLSHRGALAVLDRIAELFITNYLRSILMTAQISDTDALQGLDQPQIRNALHIMQTRFKDNWSIGDLADQVGMSRTSFFNKFLTVVGKTPIQHLTDLRMCEAVKLLSNDNLKLADIARRVGYESDISFNRAFRRVHGVSPSNFRQKPPLATGAENVVQTPFAFVVIAAPQTGTRVCERPS